jgi:hypothetical protein
MASSTVAALKAGMALEVEELRAAQEKERERVLAKLAREHEVAMERLKKEWVRKLKLKQEEEMLAFKDGIGMPRGAYAAALERTASSSSAQSSASTASASTRKVVHVNGCRDCVHAKLMFCGCTTLECRDCSTDFTFTGGEARFYKERGFTVPTRCCGCRDKKKKGKGK